MPPRRKIPSGALFMRALLLPTCTVSRSSRGVASSAASTHRQIATGSLLSTVPSATCHCISARFTGFCSPTKNRHKTEQVRVNIRVARGRHTRRPNSYSHPPARHPPSVRGITFCITRGWCWNLVPSKNPRNCFQLRGLRLEAGVGIEPTHKSFADSCLTTWLPRLRGAATVAAQNREDNTDRTSECNSGSKFLKSAAESGPRSGYRAAATT